MNFYLLGKEDKALKEGNKNFSKHEFEYIWASLSIQQSLLLAYHHCYFKTNNFIYLFISDCVCERQLMCLFRCEDIL